MKAVTLTYPPEIYLNKCERDRPCKSVSGTVFTIVSLIAKDVNFTLSVYEESSGHWEFKEINGTMHGVLSSVVEGLNDLPMASWFPSPYRHSFADFTMPFREDPVRCIASGKQMSTEHNFFLLKPLSMQAWVGVALISGVCLLGTWTINVNRMWLVVGGLSSALVIAYYSAAQTMFLVSDREMPFETIYEGLAENENWHPLLLSGESHLIGHLFAYSEYDAVKAIEHGDYFKEHPIGTKQAMDILNKGNYFIISGLARIKLELQELPTHLDYHLVTFCKPTIRPTGFLVPKTSPFKQALNKGLANLRQTGAMAQLQARWKGDLGPSSQQTQTITLSQVVLIFQAGLVVLLACLILLVLERRFAHLSDSKRMSRRLTVFLRGDNLHVGRHPLDPPSERQQEDGVPRVWPQVGQGVTPKWKNFVPFTRHAACMPPSSSSSPGPPARDGDDVKGLPGLSASSSSLPPAPPGSPVVSHLDVKALHQRRRGENLRKH